MKSLFGLGRLKDKLNAQRFEYAVTIHNLQPWPESGNRAVAIGWQRGKKKRGATRSVYPSTQPGKLGNVARFNERFELSATLYKAPTGSANPNKLGPFKKKCLILAILETDGRTQATAALGRVVIDLSEFAAIDKQETRAFMVSCNKQIHSAVGEPQLLITIRTRWKQSSATVGVSGDGDDNGSMSTDTTGSRMTNNLSSFLRYKVGGQGPATADPEQDLGGFGNRGFDKNMMDSVKSRVDDNKGSMNAIHEDDEGLESPGGIGMPPMTRPPLGGPRPPRPPLYGDSNGHGVGPRSAIAAVQNVGRPIVSVSNNNSSNGYAPSSPQSTTDDLSTPNQPIPRSLGAGIQHTNSMNSMSENMNNELLMTAASELTVHMA